MPISSRFSSKTLLGTDYSYDKTNEYRVFGSAAGIDITDPVYCGLACLTLPAGTEWNNKQRSTGLYLQEELTFDERWIATVGGRYDQVDTDNVLPDSGTGYTASDDAFTKRFGLTYKPVEGLAVYANYSESFQPISADRTSLVGQPKPQEGTQYEAGVKYRPEGLDALFTLALFDLTQTNVPYYVSQTTQSQIGEVNVRGVEFESKVAMTDRVNLTAAYSYWDAEIVEDGIDGNKGNRPQQVPEHLASLWADYTIPGSGPIGDLTLGAGLRYVGPTFADNANTLEVGGHTLVDAAVHYKITENASASIVATNLFDKEYVNYVDTYTDTAYYGDGRSIRGTLKYSW